MSATDDDWTAAPQGQPAPGSLRFHMPVGVLLPPQLTAQLCAAFAALTVALMTTVPHGQRSATPQERAAAGLTATANPDPIARDPATSRFAYEPATGPLPDTWWVRLSFKRGYPSTGAMLGGLSGKVREARIEDSDATPVIAVKVDARTDESVVATARRIAETFRQRPDASTVRLNFGPTGAESGITYEVAGSGDDPVA